jgi:hypothetical protein
MFPHHDTYFLPSKIKIHVTAPHHIQVCSSIHIMSRLYFLVVPAIKQMLRHRGCFTDSSVQGPLPSLLDELSDFPCVFHTPFQQRRCPATSYKCTSHLSRDLCTLFQGFAPKLKHSQPTRPLALERGTLNSKTCSAWSSSVPSKHPCHYGGWVTTAKLQHTPFTPAT